MLEGMCHIFVVFTCTSSLKDRTRTCRLSDVPRGPILCTTTGANLGIALNCSSKLPQIVPLYIQVYNKIPEETHPSWGASVCPCFPLCLSPKRGRISAVYSGDCCLASYTAERDVCGSQFNRNMAGMFESHELAVNG